MILIFLGGISLGAVFGTILGIRFGRTVHHSNGWNEGFKCAKDIYKRRMNDAYGKFSSMPEGARKTACPECGFTYGTHSKTCPLFQTGPANDG